MSENIIVMHCAPTLAGIKTGNLFSISLTATKLYLDDIRKLNSVLTEKGIRMVPLKVREQSVLIYVYRPSSLQEDLNDKEVILLLKRMGYPVSSPEQCVAYLAKRLKEKDDFPHEIGLFLGYPLEDVMGFIENKAQNYKCIGTWKVYGDEVAAQKRFVKYRKCTEDYCERTKRGESIGNLAVAL